MIEPIQFGFNQETFASNSFQHKPTVDEAKFIQEKALREFKLFALKLDQLGVNLHLFQDTLDQFTPDSIFPNNWISTHENGQMFTYPMAVTNRRKERKAHIIQELIDLYGFTLSDLSSWENESPSRFLEGTGSMIFDRTNRICYAALSPRTHLSALLEFGQLAHYEVLAFEAYGKNGEAIYHTNVMLSVGTTFVCVGLETVNLPDRLRLMASFEKTKKEVIEFTNDQIYSHFAGNMLQVKNRKDESVLILSKRIYDHLTVYQKTRLEAHNDHILPIDIQTIEKIGGGSVRCMLAEIFKPLV